jgi:hypothetical protein
MRIFVIGASLEDTGNAYCLSKGKVPNQEFGKGLNEESDKENPLQSFFPSYGRFTDKDNWIDVLSECLSYKLVNVFCELENKGFIDLSRDNTIYNFAIGGASTLDIGFLMQKSNVFNIASLNEQINENYGILQQFKLLMDNYNPRCGDILILNPLGNDLFSLAFFLLGALNGIRGGAKDGIVRNLVSERALDIVKNKLGELRMQVISMVKEARNAGFHKIILFADSNYLNIKQHINKILPLSKIVPVLNDERFLSLLNENLDFSLLDGVLNINTLHLLYDIIQSKMVGSICDETIVEFLKRNYELSSPIDEYLAELNDNFCFYDLVHPSSKIHEEIAVNLCALIKDISEGTC